MPHLDAAALTSDTDGLDFLRQVLDVPGDVRIPQNAFDLPKASAARALTAVDMEVNRPRRRVAVSESV